MKGYRSIIGILSCTCVGLASIAGAVDFSAENWLHMGGTPIGAAEVYLNLDTGDFELKQKSLGDEVVTKNGNVDQAKLSKIRQLAVRAAESGMETAACKTSRKTGLPELPNPDAIIGLRFSLRHKIHHASVRPDCQSA